MGTRKHPYPEDVPKTLRNGHPDSNTYMAQTLSSEDQDSEHVSQALCNGHIDLDGLLQMPSNKDPDPENVSQRSCNERSDSVEVL